MRRRVLGLVVVAAATLTCGCAFSALTATPKPSASASSSVLGVTFWPVAQRKPAPAITAHTLAGGTFALTALRGKAVVVVNVWASWCADCRSESPALARLATATRRYGVRFVGIDEQDSAPKARAFAASAHTEYPQLVDADGALLARLSVLPSYGIPSTLVVDRRGLMAASVVGAVDAGKLRQLIAKVRAGH